MSAKRPLRLLAVIFTQPLVGFAVLAMTLAVDCRADGPYVPFEIPKGFVILGEPDAANAIPGGELFEIGGFALQHTDGALIYKWPLCVIPPERSKSEIRRELLEFLRSPEERYYWPFHKVQEQRVFEVRGTQWIWIAGETFQRGRMHFFIHAQSEFSRGYSEIHALAPIDQRDSIASTFMEVIDSMTATLLREE